MISLLVMQGCMRLIGEGAEAGLGPSGKYYENKMVAPSKDRTALADYRNMELVEFKNEYGQNVPNDFLRAFPIEFRRHAEGAGLLNPGGKTIGFKVAVIHYETADMTDNVFGPLEQAVARVEMIDKDTGRVLATGNALGRTGKTVGLGPEKKAVGLAKALLKWVEDYSPKKTKDQDRG